jgi:preprotein translocase subunit SecB
MTDAPETPAEAPAAPQEAHPPLVIHGQYIKDLSFEAPNTPEIFRVAGEPQDIPIGIDVKVRKLEDGAFEVVLHLKVEAKTSDRVAFLFEIAYAGLCSIHVPEQHVEPVLLVEVPRLLFPFVRAIVADMTKDGGFPPLMITPIDFAELYRQRVQRAQAPATTH